MSKADAGTTLSLSGPALKLARMIEAAGAEGLDEYEDSLWAFRDSGTVGMLCSMGLAVREGGPSRIYLTEYGLSVLRDAEEAA